MARANIAATRAVLPHVHLDGIDWPAVRVALTLPCRRLGDGRSLGEIFQEGWRPILESIHREVDVWERADDELGPQTVLRLLTIHGSRTESVGEWWGSGWYETLTRLAVLTATRDESLPANVIDVFSSAGHFADVAAHSPDMLDDDQFSWLTRTIFSQESERRNTGLPTPIAVTLPDWLIEQLTELLVEDEEANKL